MRLISFDEMLAMPAGTVFQRWEHNQFWETCIKVGNSDDSPAFHYDHLIRIDANDVGEYGAYIARGEADSSAQLPLDTEWTLDMARYESENEKYLVLDIPDLDQLLARLNRARAEMDAGPLPTDTQRHEHAYASR